MADVRANVEMAARNAAVIHDLSVEAITSYDPKLWRGPRLLVPMHVDALVVEGDDRGREWAKVRLNPHAISGYSKAYADSTGEIPPAGDQKHPAPFETYSGEEREPGVHLHWALPDGLTKGEQLSNSGAELPPAVVPRPDETDPEGLEFPRTSSEPERFGEPTVPEETAFPRIPDRWLVVRMYSGLEGGHRLTTSWVIQSEERDPNKRVQPLAAWRENRSDSEDERWMTALGTGDPAFHAYYDNVRDVLGFHDALQNVSEGPLTYLVVGWYSDRKDDPLYKPDTIDEWLDRLSFMGWSLGADKKDDRRIAEAAVREQSGGIFATIAKMARDAKSVLSSSSIFKRYWPRQLLCHGAVYDVSWGGQGGRFAPTDAGPPHSGKVQVAVGNTGVEALAALVASRRDQPSFERILSAFHYGLLDQLSDPDGLAALESLLHSEDFVPKPGGFMIDFIEQGDLFPRTARSEGGKLRASRGEVVATKERTYQAWSTLPVERDDLDIRKHTVGGDAQAHRTVRATYRHASANPEHLNVRARSASETTVRAYKDTPITAPGGGAGLLAEQVRERFGGNLPTLTDSVKRRKVATRRALPRFWEPRDPVVLLSEPRRSYRYGEDGRLTDDETLPCRISGQTVTSIRPILAQALGGGDPARAVVRPGDLVANRLQSGQIPPEAVSLFNETLLLDLGNARQAAEILLQQDLDALAPHDAYHNNPISTDAMTLKIQVEQTIPLNPYVDDQRDAQAFLGISGVEGTMPVPFAVKPWRPPWTPLHLDWEVEWVPSAQGQRDWTLAEHDYEPATGVDAAALSQIEAGASRAYTGRTLLTPAVSRVVSDRLGKFLEEQENEAEPGSVRTPRKTANLETIREVLDQTDVLASALGGLHEMLLGLEDEYRFFDTDDPVPNVEETAQPVAGQSIYPVRAGHLRICRLRIVDGFGQFYDVEDTARDQPIRAEDMRAPDHPDLLRLPPRIVQSSRLMFRMLSAASDDVEATKRNTPICGWIVPDHLDQSMEVYDGDGKSLGQVQFRVSGLGERLGGVEWQGVPGAPGPFGGDPQVPNAHTRRFVSGLIAHGERDAEAGIGTLERSDSVLTALLRMIDATLWTVDPLGQEGDEHLSVLVGRPLALVRAELRLEVDGQPFTEELARTEFGVRLGALTRLSDGLMGYFVNDDYSVFFPVHETIADQARAARPHHGFLNAIGQVPDFYQRFGISAQPVKHPYVNREPTVKIRPNQTVLVTLLVDPRGGVHATSGILPRKRIELMREHVADALDALSLTFRVGPVLTDPETIRMPLPSEISGGWSWIRRTGVTVWQEDAVVDATQDAMLGKTPTLITEGWLKLTGGFKKK
jgi:hypothetical protein